MTYDYLCLKPSVFQFPKCTEFTISKLTSLEEIGSCGIIIELNELSQTLNIYSVKNFFLYDEGIRQISEFWTHTSMLIDVCVLAELMMIGL